MLKHFCFGMHLLPPVAKLFNEEGLDESMSAHHSEGEAASFFRERDCPVRRMLHERLFRQFLNGLGCRCRPNSHARGNLRGRHGFVRPLA